jgi:hypothetical protein
LDVLEIILRLHFTALGRISLRIFPEQPCFSSGNTLRLSGLNTSHFVAVPPDRDDEPVREFPSSTVDLIALVDWLKSCSVDTVANRATQALKLAAAAIRSSQSALGAYFRRMCARMDKPKAVTAAAHKLARLIYMMLTKGEEYTDQGQDYYEERYRQRVLRQLAQRAENLDMKLVATEQLA